MKRIILLFIITLTSLTISVKEVVKNPATEKSLDNTMNIYSIKGNSEVLTLGTEGRVSASTVSTNTNLCFPTSVWK